MNIDLADVLRQLLLFTPPFILSLSFHEFAHAWVADRLGDSTARYMGRLTMDPMAHISMMGTVIFPAISLLTGAPLFGWANPVPIDMRNFKKPRAGMAIVAAAGPLSNILLATICTAILAAIAHSSPLGIMHGANAGMKGAANEMLIMAIQLNLFLAFFNLVPIPPLDGSRIVQGIVSRTFADKIDQWGVYGNWLLLALFFMGLFRILAVPVILFMNLLFSVFGLI